MLYLGITCWWLTQDRSIPVFDAGLHLQYVLGVHEELAAGHLGGALTRSIPYPPFVYLIGALGMTIGGIGVAPPIIAENFVFIPLLALGCYHVGRRAFGPEAGFLAVVFALGSPLIVSIFHVVMIDGPETAMVAVSVWAILASENFARPRISAIAGLCVGLGMLTKEPFGFFVAGPLLVVLARGGGRRWRGLLAFASVALVVALPWYLSELSLVKALGTGSFVSPTGSHLPADIAPKPFSLDNFEWYGWNILNAQLYLPMFLLAGIGWIWTLLGFLRRRPVSALAPELAVGAFIGWLAITETFAHDTRYSMPLLVYLAVFAAGWITRIPNRARLIASAFLVIVAIANTAGVIFGVGREVRLSLPGAEASDRQGPGLVMIFSNGGFLTSAPHRDGDILSVLRDLRHAGVTTIVLGGQFFFESDFSGTGLQALAKIAGEKILDGASPASLTSRDASFAHQAVVPGEPPPCIRLSDGTGVWIWRGNPNVSGSEVCPLKAS